jgi:hypothetical protein
MGVSMAAENFTSGTVGWMAISTGIAGILALVFILLFYAFGQPFGTLNDIFNGLLAIASGALACGLYAEYHAKSPLASQIALVLALVGVVIAVIGSVLVIFKFTGWVLAGFYTGVGDALIGLWLAMFCYAMLRHNTLSHNLVLFGLVVGVLMAFGLISILGIISRIDSMDSMPWYLNIGYVGFLGTYVLYPIWTIWLGRMLLSK